MQVPEPVQEPPQLPEDKAQPEKKEIPKKEATPNITEEEQKKEKEDLKAEEERKKQEDLKAEEERKKQEDLKAEEERKKQEDLKAEEERKKQEDLKAEEERKKQEDLKAEEERKKQEDLKAEEERKKQENLKAEEERKKQENLKAEEERKKQERLRAEEEEREQERLRAEEEKKQEGESFWTKFKRSTARYSKAFYRSLVRFYKKYLSFPKNIAFFLGDSTLKYTGSSPPTSITYADLDIDSLEGDISVSYPNEFPASALHIVFTGDFFKDRFLKGTALELGFDYRHSSTNEGDRPLKASGTAEILRTGEVRQVESKIDYKYTYSYYTLIIGAKYSLVGIFISPHLRYPLPNAYTEETNSQSDLITQKQSLTGQLTGSIGFGFTLGYDFEWSKGYRVGIRMLYSNDNLDFDGAKYTNTFMGFGTNVGF